MVNVKKIIKIVSYLWIIAGFIICIANDLFMFRRGGLIISAHILRRLIFINIVPVITLLGITIKEKVDKKEEGNNFKLKIGSALTIISLISFIFISISYYNFYFSGNGVGITSHGMKFMGSVCVIIFIIGVILIKLPAKGKNTSISENTNTIPNNETNLETKSIGTKEIYEFKRTGVAPIYVVIDGNWLAIDRKGIYNKVQHGLDGIKKIHIKNISSVQFKEGSSVAAGYIQLAIQGSQESKGGFKSANSDENTIMFGASYNDLAKKLVNNIERKIDELQSSQAQTIIQQPTQTKAQQIKEFKELLDEGIITQEEFDKKKNELLN